MKLRSLLLLAGLGSVTGCTLSDNEQLGLDEVQKRYGGKVSFKIGTVASTNATHVQGKVLELDVVGANFTKYGDNLGLPASTSALLLYHHMSKVERADYDGLQVVLQNGTSGRKFNFRMPVLARAEQAESQLRILLDNWRQHNYQAVANCWTQAALRGPSRAGLVAEVIRQGEKIGPIASFTPEGYIGVEVPVNGHLEQLLNAYVTLVAPTGSTQQMVFCLNPQLPASGQFLYGLAFLNPLFTFK
ncbi:MAG: hypothetical protein EOO55_01635 [Hymenobacter sp.]|nr:MAG: hypothetical protein EOO55_01635 [Hymenobacter sp.]